MHMHTRTHFQQTLSTNNHPLLVDDFLISNQTNCRKRQQQQPQQQQQQPGRLTKNHRQPHRRNERRIQGSQTGGLWSTWLLPCRCERSIWHAGEAHFGGGGDARGFKWVEVLKFSSKFRFHLKILNSKCLDICVLFLIKFKESPQRFQWFLIPTHPKVMDPNMVISLQWAFAPKRRCQFQVMSYLANGYSSDG